MALICLAYEWNIIYQLKHNEVQSYYQCCAFLSIEKPIFGFKQCSQSVTVVSWEHADIVVSTLGPFSHWATMRAVTAKTGVVVGSCVCILTSTLYTANYFQLPQCDRGFFVEKDLGHIFLFYFFPLSPFIPVLVRFGSVFEPWTQTVFGLVLLKTNSLLLMGTLAKKRCLMLPWLIFTIYIWMADLCFRAFTFVYYWTKGQPENLLPLITMILSGAWILPAWMMFYVNVWKVFKSYENEENNTEPKDPENPKKV